MGRIQPPTSEMLNLACEYLTAGRLVAIPTETVYGLAANAWDSTAVMRIYSAKNRPPHNPLIVHLASIERMAEAVAMPLPKPLQRQLDAISDLWPGPLTVVLPASDRIAKVVTAGNTTVAIRIPSHPVALSLLQRCPFPLAAPSANPSNYVSPTTAEHCERGLGTSVAMILDGGACDYGVESTIVALTARGPHLLRPGGITAETLAERFNIPIESLLNATGKKQPRKQLEAPGMMAQHYSPITPLRLLYPGTTITIPENTGRIAFRTLDDDQMNRYASMEVLSETGDLEQIAKRLFAALRRLDDANLDCIHVDTCPRSGLGRAIMDRLERAAARSIER